MRPSLKKLLTFVLFTRVLILVLPWFTVTLLFPEATAQNFIEFTQTSWNRWDAPHYMYLAQNWYTNVGDPANFIVFFPLYPLLLKPLIALAVNPVLSAIFLSTVFFIIAAYFMYKFLSEEYSETVARKAVIAMSIFPTTYFFNAPYTESLFLFIFWLTFYASKKRDWLLGGVFAGLGAVTRPFGILLLPSLITEWLMSKSKKWYELLFITAPSILSLTFYLYLNKSIYNDPFAFRLFLLNNWQKHFVSPITGVISTWKIAFSGGLSNFVIMVGWAEALTITISWILVPIVFKVLRKSWAVYYLLSLILISSTSFILSTPRYLLSIPPVFVLIALAEKNYFFKLVFRFTSIALLFCLSILFTRGQWAF